jgi:hypothetical protein
MYLSLTNFLVLSRIAVPSSAVCLGGKPHRLTPSPRGAMYSSIKFSDSHTHCSTLFCIVQQEKASPSDPVPQRRHVFVTYKNDTGSFLCARVIAPVNSSQQETASPRPCPHFLLKQIHSCTRALHCSCRLLAGDGFAAALSSRSAYNFCFKTN